MNGWNRALTTLLAAAAAGFLLWLASTFDLHHTGGYWAAMGIVAGCGLLLGLAQLRGMGGNPPAMFLLCFAPVLVCAGWVLLYAQPHAVWGRGLIHRWSGDIGIGGAVHHLATWNGVLAFGIGLVFALVLEPGLVRRRREVVATEPAPVYGRPAMDPAAADEPTLAERRDVGTPVDSGVTRTTTTIR